jgi:hypothetical protein
MPFCMPELIPPPPPPPPGVCVPPVTPDMGTPCPDEKPKTLRYELRFGATPTSPIGPPVPCAVPRPGHELCPYLEPDYVPNYEAVVPQTIRSCGASFVSFQPMTEGAQRAIFDVDPHRTSVVIDCIKRRVPQGHVEAVVEAIGR